MSMGIKCQAKIDHLSQELSLDKATFTEKAKDLFTSPGEVSPIWPLPDILMRFCHLTVSPSDVIINLNRIIN